MQSLKIFIGYDPKESVAFSTLVNSIHRNSSIPVSITPVNLHNLAGCYHRPHDLRQSNSFSFSRFLTPYLSDYSGWSLFMDCDMLVRCDIKELMSLIDNEKAVMVVKHDYVSKVKEKYLGTKQYNYPRKNWSSLILWNCSHPKNKQITPEVIASAEAAYLHRFLWLDDDEIGSLDERWNWLVGEYDKPPEDVKIVHWTLGGPYFREYKDVDFADEWFKEYNLTTHCEQRVD